MSDAASRMGALTLGSGTGSFRVLQAMRQVAAALGIDRLQAQVTLTHIVSTTTRQGIFRTQVVEVPTPSVNADRIAALQAIARDLPGGSSVAELDARLDEVEHRAALYGTRWLVLAAAVACAAFAFLNNGGWAECLVVFAAVACGRLAQLVLARRKINQLACVLVAAAIGCLVYVTATTGIHHLDPGAAGLHASAFTSSVLFLVPGFPLMTAALDLARNDLASGIQRLTYAGLIIFSAGLGSWMVVAVTGVSPATAPVPAIGLAALFTRKYRRTLEAKAMFALLSLPVATLLLAWIASQVTPAWVSRYFAPILGAVLLLAALGLSRAGVAGPVALALSCIFLINVASYTPKYKSDMRDVGGEMAPLLHPGDLVISGQPDQIAVTWYYMPGGLRWASTIGPVSDPRYMNWVDALKRLQDANPATTFTRLMATVQPGQQILFVRPLTAGAENWEAPWTQLVRRRSAQWGELFASDKQLKEVAYAPHAYPGATILADSAVLYKKVS